MMKEMSDIDTIIRGCCLGNCDIMALALHKLTGRSMGLWSGKYADPDADDGFSYEYAHACIILSASDHLEMGNPSDSHDAEWMDVNGISRNMPGNLLFNMPVYEVVLLPSSESEVRNAFTTCEIEDVAIQAAIDFVRSYQPLAEIIFQIKALTDNPSSFTLNNL